MIKWIKDLKIARNARKIYNGLHDLESAPSIVFYHDGSIRLNYNNPQGLSVLVTERKFVLTWRSWYLKTEYFYNIYHCIDMMRTFLKRQ